ncbi:hypothetical protein E2C01_016976 [Portunus trituberculatus]|uniref:Uncharacterized protein n=1 Tax=Portunus trituberculatus TaxID=210409 RepID=A0A5B7DS33_PORTR|nr:hypothetical protein [Portunus trituberculatus]
MVRQVLPSLHSDADAAAAAGGAVGGGGGGDAGNASVIQRARLPHHAAPASPERLEVREVGWRSPA